MIREMVQPSWTPYSLNFKLASCSFFLYVEKFTEGYISAEVIILYFGVYTQALVIDYTIGVLGTKL